MFSSVFANEQTERPTYEPTFRVRRVRDRTADRSSPVDSPAPSASRPSSASWHRQSSRSEPYACTAVISAAKLVIVAKPARAAAFANEPSQAPPTRARGRVSQSLRELVAAKTTDMSDKLRRRGTWHACGSAEQTMPIARHRSPDLTWSFELPDQLKIAIADAIVLYRRIDSCCVEIIWELEQANLERKKEIAKARGDQNFRLLKQAVHQIPGAKTDKIWAALMALGKERNLIGHGVWMWTNESDRWSYPLEVFGRGRLGRGRILRLE